MTPSQYEHAVARYFEAKGYETRVTALTNDAGVDVFHCSTRRFWQPEFDGSPLNLAGWTKKLTGKPVITVGSVGLDNDFISGLFSRESAGVEGLDRRPGDRWFARAPRRRSERSVAPPR